jgi:hypothetical protein
MVGDGSEAASVGRPTDRPKIMLLPKTARDTAARLGIPDPQGTVARSRSDALAVRRNHHVRYSEPPVLLVALPDLLPGGKVPSVEAPISMARNQAAAIWEYVHAPTCAFEDAQAPGAQVSAG